MTARALILPAETGRQDWRRWSLAAAIVLAAHAGLIATYLLLPKAVPQGAPPVPVVTIDLAPVPVSPSAADDQAGPQQSEEVPPPQAKPPVEPQIEVPPKIEAPTDVVLPQAKPAEPPEAKPEPAQKVEPPKIQHKPAAKRSTAARTEHRAERAAAPATGAEVSRAVATWRDQVYQRLQAAKRYPGGADGSGTVLISFTVNRSGQVTAKSVVRSSGNSAFDEEALAMVSRAAPFPRFPDAIQASELRLPVPVNFARR